jgi:2-dehydropantoate 2-reductase
MTDGTIAIAGAGSIGCFVGGMLAGAGKSVSLLARPRIIAEIQTNGLRVTTSDGLDRQVASNTISLSDDPSVFRDAGIVLVCVKSVDTAEVAKSIALYALREAVIVSLQNGIGNASVLREKLPGRKVLAGMVPFNVMAKGGGRFHRGTAGDIVIERDGTGTAPQLSVPGLTMQATDNIAGVQWGKLLVNLSNALNALSNLPLSQELAQRPWRRLLADQVAEGLAAMKAEGIKPVAATPIPASWTPHILRLPEALFGLVMGRAMKIDPEARSSMWADLQRGRRTEIDYLQGVIVEIAERHGLKVPLSRRIVDLIKSAEAAGKGSPELKPEQVRA